MADFNFDALKKEKEAEYKKNTIKTLGKNKTTAGLVLVKFTRDKKPKKVAIFVPFIKVVDAKEACATIVKENLHPKKFVACVEVTYDSKAIDGYKLGEITLTPITSKGSLDGGKLLKETSKPFKEDLQMKLTVTGFSETELESSTDDVVSDSSTDIESDTNETTITDLKVAFQEAKQLYKQVGQVDPKLKAKTMLATWNKLESLMPELEKFISSSDKEAEVQTATKISAAAKTIQDTLKPHVDNIKAKQSENKAKKGETSNKNLEALTSGIKNKAAQLLAQYADEIASLDKDMPGFSDNLKNISQIA